MASAAPKTKYHLGTGRRKTSVARVRIKEGSGRITVNGKQLEEYFSLNRNCEFAKGPLLVTKTQRNYDIFATLTGGGTSGQAGAFVMGLGRALLSANPEFLKTLRDNNFLTRDSRMVERKKYGHKKARRSFQYSKR